MIVSGVLLGIALLASPSNGVAVSGSDEKGGSAIFRYATAGAMAMLVYAAVPTAFSWLRLFATDYVIGFVFFAGLALLAMRGQRIMGIRSALGIPCAIAILAAAYVIILPGVWAGGNTLHLAPHEARWWRLPLIALAVLPLLIADEIYIRPIRPWWKAATLAFATRMVLAGFLLTGALTFNRSAGFLVVIIHLIVFFWMLLWLLGESINRGTRNSFATALFGAIIQAWLFASVFVTK
jgi:hypothetical protein